MTINDNSTKSINAAIIDLQNQIKQLQHKIGILNKNQLKEDDIEFPGKVEYADEAGKAKEADHAKTADIISGTLAVERGGTGQTTQAGINKAIVGELEEGNEVVTDGTMFVSSYASDNGFADTNAVNVPYKRKFSRVWEYIKGKISSVLGLTASNYGGKANTAGTADRAKGMDYYVIDLSALSTDNFYPVFFYTANRFAEVAISSPQLLGAEQYNQNRIHFDISTYGWSDCPRTLNIREYACFSNNEITIGSIGFGLTWGGWAIWLRGGLQYNVFTKDAVPEPKTSDFDFGDSSKEIYTVGKNYYGGSNTNVDIVFTPQSTISNGTYSIRGITTAGNIIAPNITALENRVAALESKVQ